MPKYPGHPYHPGKLEVIRRVQLQDELVLVAIGLEPDERGAYGVASAYRVSEAELARWRQSGRLKTPKR